MTDIVFSVKANNGFKRIMDNSAHLTSCLFLIMTCFYSPTRFKYTAITTTLIAP